MRLIKQILAFFFLFFGVPLSLLMMLELVNPNASNEDKKNATAALIIFTLPSTVIGGGLLWSSLQGKQKIQKTQETQSEEILRRVFFKLLEENGNEITILQMSKTANIDGKEAKEYLDQKAIEFNATFEVGESGGIIYKFH